MNPLPHRIHRQRWLVKASTQEEAFAMRLQLRSQIDTSLLPVFESAFDTFDAGEELVHIPRLSIELKLRPGENFIAVLSDVLRDRLSEVLQDVVIDRPTQEGVQRIAVQASHRRILLNYLTTGQTEWHAYTGDADSLARVLHTEAGALADGSQALLDVISGSLAQRIAIGFRLLQLLPSESRPDVLALAPLRSVASLPDKPPVTAAAAVTLLPVFLQQLTTSGVPGSYLLLRVQALLLALRAEDIHYPLDTHILTLLHECTGQPTTHASTDALRAVLHMMVNSSPETVTHRLAHERSTITSMTTPESVAPNLHRPVAEPASDAPDNFPDVVAPPRAPSIMQPSDIVPGVNQGYPANDAGLVLLHPFLSRLFDAAGIAPAGTLELPEAVLPRAAAMLHWLANGREEIYEFELTTIKVLLGLAPDSVLLVDAGLISEADRAEAEALLTAAISHWDALGNTSVSALRMSFLQRRGLLRDIGSGWQLQVEPESFDLLLGKLPWGISIVRLPWMTKPIFTDWPTP